MEINTIIGRRVKKYREKSCLSREELGLKIGKNQAAIAKIEEGRYKRLTLFLLFEIVDALDCDFKEFIKGL